MKKINVLMVGVDKSSIGGMRTVSENYIKSKAYNEHCNLFYVSTATRKNALMKVFFFAIKMPIIFFILLFKKIDIVHVHMAEKNSVFRKGVIIQLSKIIGCKIIIHMHAGPFMNWYGNLSCRTQRRVKRILDKANIILVLGKFWKEQAKDIIGEERIKVLYNGVECPPINNYNALAKDISFVGHLRKEKGIFEFLESIKSIRSKLPESTKIHLCGSSDQFDIKQKLSEMGIDDIVYFHGWLNNTNLKKIFSNTAINVLPTYIEGLSMSVLESMAAGIPIITTNITTMPELLDGIIEMITPGDISALSNIILDLIYDSDKRKKISDTEYERVKTCFSTDKMIQQTIAVYEMVLCQ